MDLILAPVRCGEVSAVCRFHVGVVCVVATRTSLCCSAAVIPPDLGVGGTWREAGATLIAEKWMGRTPWAMIHALLAGLAALGPGRVAAQGGPLLSGVVTDTLEVPLPLAELVAVRVGDGGAGRYVARAGAAGRFAFRDIRPGRYAMTVRRIGYNPIQVTIELRDGAPQWVQFELVSRPQQLPDVLVDVEADRRGPGPLFRGTVVDENQRPIELAEVVVGGQRGRMRGPFQRTTDARGRFAFPELRGGRYAVTVRRIGYAPVQATLALRSDSARNVQFVLATWPRDLPEIVVERRNNLVRGARRASTYDGFFLTRDDIARAAPKTTGEFLRRYLPNVSPYQFRTPNMGIDLPPVFVADDDPAPRSASGLSVPYRKRLNAAEAREKFIGTDCPPVISINGAPARVGFAIDDFDPQIIEAIEVYRRRLDPRHPPPFEFQEDLVMKRSCGALVVIWLKGR